MEVEGHPMAWWPVKAAFDAPSVDRIFVSTDDPAVMDVAAQFEAMVIERPAWLATDEALGEDAYVHAHHVIKETLSTDVEAYVLLMANAVTISPSLIEEGVAILRGDPGIDSAVTVSRYNMWSPLRARRIAASGLLEPFVPLTAFGDPATLDCDRDSQGDVWFADMGVSVIRPGNLDDLHAGQLPQKWMGRRIAPIRNVGGLDVDYAFQLPQAAWWLRQHAEEDRQVLS